MSTAGPIPSLGLGGLSPMLFRRIRVGEFII